jgi:hypothetical protein
MQGLLGRMRSSCATPHLTASVDECAETGGRNLESTRRHEKHVADAQPRKRRRWLKENLVGNVCRRRETRRKTGSTRLKAD